MKLLSARLLLTYCIISLMLLQLMVSAADFHLHFPTDKSHTHTHTSTDSIMLASEASHDHPTHDTSDVYNHHCCHSVSNSLAIAVSSTPLLPKPLVQLLLYKSDLYQTPVFDALIRPPIT